MNFPSSKKLTAAVLLAALTATSIAPGAVLAADSSDNVATVQPGGDQPPEKPPGDQQPTPPDGGKPGEQPPAKPGGADTMEYDYTGELSGAVTADGEEVTRDGETISTETKDQNVGLAQNGGSLTLTDATLDKSGSDTNGDNCNFYGINSILLSVNDDSVIKVADSKLTADSTGSNAIFATDGGTVYANNNTIVTSASNSRGLDATYGGTVIGNLLAISTAGDHSAALATDRGGGNISLTNSSLFTAGSGSPLLYSTGNVQVDNVKGTATGSQIAGMEGLNTILIKNSRLTSEVTGKTASDPVANGVIIYQSTSGDAEAATGETAEFEAENSTLASDIQEGSMFYLTNTTANIVLKTPPWILTATQQICSPSAGTMRTTGVRQGKMVPMSPSPGWIRSSPEISTSILSPALTSICWTAPPTPAPPPSAKTPLLLKRATHRSASALMATLRGS